MYCGILEHEIESIKIYIIYIYAVLILFINMTDITLQITNLHKIALKMFLVLHVNIMISHSL